MPAVQDSYMDEQFVQNERQVLLSYVDLITKRLPGHKRDQPDLEPVDHKVYNAGTKNCIIDIKYKYGESFIYARISCAPGKKPKCLHVQDHDGKII